MREQFTKEQGFDIQKQQLDRWKPKLSNALYSDLLAFVEEDNAKLPENATGYDVCRGTEFDNFIANWKY
jgi:hypothetical protein